jgi:protoheme IX farnesyltransferase
MQFIKDFGKLIKFRVNVIVVLSSIFGYLIGVGSGNVSFYVILGLSLGGFFTTGAAHAINQLIESRFDAEMSRTKDRPLPTGRMKTKHVLFYAILMTLLGVFFFAYFTNTLVLILGASSLFIYAFVYTPMKRVNAIAVFIGAIPGALPPMIGFVAASNAITDLALLLFLFQFVWQFPHFWSIAWIYNDEYQKAGYNLLPTKNGRTKQNAFITFLSSMLLIPTLLAFYLYGFVGLKITALLVILSIWFIYTAYIFYKTPSLVYAKKLMKGSIIYLPIVQLIMVLLFFNK